MYDNKCIYSRQTNVAFFMDMIVGMYFFFIVCMFHESDFNANVHIV